MKQQKPQMSTEKWNALWHHASHSPGLLGALAGVAYYSYGDWRRKFWDALIMPHGKAYQTVVAEDLMCPELKDAMAALANPETAETLFDIIALRLEGQFSLSHARRSYRTSNFSYYKETVLDLLCQLIRASCYPGTIVQQLSWAEIPYNGFDYRLALEIRRGNEEVISLLREAILGDSARIPLTRQIIEAVIISGHDELLEDLLKLLLAAKLQEGLRQQILEAADKGSIRVFCRILKFCIDNDLFRYSSTVRSMEVWTGLGFAENKASLVKKGAQLAYDCLTDEAARLEAYRSGNNVEAYYALWAQGCHEFMTLYDSIGELLEDPRHYRRVLGWHFVTYSDSYRYRMDMATRYLEERDEELLAWIIRNLAQTWQLLNSYQMSFRDGSRQCVPSHELPDSKEERLQLFDRLKAVAAFIGNRKKTFTGNPFGDSSVTLENDRVYHCMLSLAAYDMDDTLIAQLLPLAPGMSVSQRLTLIRGFLLPETNEAHRAFLRECLNDRSVTVKELAVERLAKCSLSADELDLLADCLRSRSSGLRAGILTAFKSQRMELLGPLISRMLLSAEENQNQAAIELLTELKDENPELLADNRAVLDGLRRKKLSTQTQILLDQLLPEENGETVYSPENGFGLYDPGVIGRCLSDFKAAQDKTPLLTAEEIRASIPTQEELNALLARLNAVFVLHADAEIEIEWYDGSRRKVLFGNTDHAIPLPASCGCRSMNDANARPDMIPFWEEFRDALGVYTTDVTKMLGLFNLTARVSVPRFPGISMTVSPWYPPIEAMQLAPVVRIESREQQLRYWKVHDILDHLPMLFDPHEVFVEAMRFYRSMIALWGEENLPKVYMQANQELPSLFYGHIPKAVGINHRMLLTWRKAIHQLTLDSDDFARWFTLQYRLEQPVVDSVTDCLQIEEYFRAYAEGIIGKDILTAYILDGNASMPGKIEILTNPKRWPQGRKLYEKYPFAKELVPRILDRIVTTEEKRGELPTPLTGHCLAIERFEGAAHFCKLLAALGKESFFRGYEYSRDTTKKAVLSRLLKRCYPAPVDTPERLAALLKATDISDNRLVEAVMYAPQWAGFAERILGWPGLKQGVWFFHAHINETFSAEKETEVAIYSPISPQQFNDGAFDKHWFLEAYGKLGEKRFQALYKSAKYITSGSNQHRRSQLYADAVLGKLDARELVQEITEKRNQEKLRCYPLIPIEPGDGKEALRRYEFIQKFLKESRQFGAQRRDSEKKACATALDNLASTTGLMDVNRLMWQMESQKFEQIRPLLEPVTLEGVSVRLTVDEKGDADIAMEKGGKAMKTAPKALAKNETFLELKATVKELKELKRRSRESMERAMADSTAFGSGELQNICTNPILAPMVLSLVWTDGNHNGFLKQTAEGFTLVKADGSAVAAGALRIAHPHDLKTHGDWLQFMGLLYEKKLIQPFKQVFREYYPLTDDERQERTLSRRYAGHQVQPQRTVALLKARGWTVDYEEGLQKVFYKENLIVRMYAMADWFSPADIESPTLETVEFFHRGTGVNVSLEDVPPVLFSETMRDLDMVVSIAHVGGVDPEASHSTMEMRAAIARELTGLLKLDNVSWIGAHAKIHGVLANYSVHMGSGVVHAEGVGMVSILPVHSQARGRIFLPFADEDPKTAEIMSKILLLAEDSKIKDPTILRQINPGV